MSSISCLSEMTISYLPTHLVLRATYLMLLRSLSLGNSRPRQQKNFTKTACSQKVIRGVSHTLNDYLKQMQHYSFCWPKRSLYKGMKGYRIMEINIRNSQGDRVLPVVQNMAAWGDTVSTWKLTCNSQGDGWVLSVVQNMAVWGDTISTWKRWIKLRTAKQKEIN